MSVDMLRQAFPSGCDCRAWGCESPATDAGDDVPLCAEHAKLADKLRAGRLVYVVCTEPMWLDGYRTGARHARCHPDFLGISPDMEEGES